MERLRSRSLVAASTLLIAASVMFSAVAAGTAAAQKAKPSADHCRSAVDPYNLPAEKSRFFRAAGVDGELSKEEFTANGKKKKGAFVRAFDTFAELKLHDKDKNGTIDWMEADSYRRNLRKRVLHAFDKNRNGRLEGAERTAANRALEKGTIPGGPKKKGLVQRMVTGEKYEAGAEMLVRFDGDGDGALSEEELKAAHKQLAGERRAQMLEEYDLDGDGTLSKDERRAMRMDRGGVWINNAKEWTLQHFDGDGDGELGEEEKQEIGAFMKKLGAVGKSMWHRMADYDGDGVVGEEEKQKIKMEMMVTGLRMMLKAKQYLDLDGDGEITADEQKAFGNEMARKSHAWFTAFCNEYDANEDNRLDAAERDELVKGIEGEMNRRIDNHDANGDGRLSPAEAEALLENFGREIGIVPKGAGGEPGGKK